MRKGPICLKSRQGDPPPSQGRGAGGGGCGIPSGVELLLMRAQLLLDGIPADKGNTTARRVGDPGWFEWWWELQRSRGAAPQVILHGGEVSRTPRQARCSGPYRTPCTSCPLPWVTCINEGFPAPFDRPQVVLFRPAPDPSEEGELRRGPTIRGAARHL